MPTSSTRKSRRGLYLGLFVVFWIVVALGAVYYVKPDFWMDTHDYFTKAQELTQQGKLTEARSNLDKALKGAPDNVGYLVYKGSLEEQADDLNAAAQSYAKALNLDSGNAEAALGLGKVLLEQGKEEQALEALRILDADKLETAMLSRRASLLAQYGKQDEAIADFRVLLEREPENTKIQRQLAASLMATEQWSEAEPVLRDYLNSSPGAEDEDWAHNQLAIALRAQKDLEGTLALLNENPTPENLRTRAEISLEMGRFEEAAPLFRELVKKNPGEKELKNKLAIALRAAGSLEEAYKAFSESPTDENLPQKAQLAMQLEKFEEAAEDYRTLLAAEPNNPLYRENLVIALRQTGQLEEAFELLKSFPTEENLKDRAQLAMQLEKFGEAAPLLQELEKKHPDDAEIKNQLAIALRAQNKLEDAYASYNDAPSVENLDERAQLAMQLEKFDEAAPLYRELLQKNPGDRKLLMQLAIALRASGQLEEAYKVYGDIASDDNLAIRAQLALQLNRYEEAATLYGELQKKFPDTPGVENNLAIALRSLDRLEESYELFSQAPSEENLQARAELALQLEKFDDAAKLYKKLAAKNPDDVKIKEQLAYALDKATSEKESEPAESEYKALVESGKASDETRVRYAWLLMREGKYSDVLDVLEPLDMTTGEVLKLRADAAFLSGDMKRAEPLLAQLTERSPDNAQVWKNLADARDSLKKPGPAADAMKRYLELEPGDTDTRLKYAALLGRSGRTSQAIAVYNEVLASDKKNQKALAGLATIHESRGEFNKALGLLQRLAKVQKPLDSGVVLRIARIYKWKKDPASATRWYERFLAMNPPSRQRWQAMAEIAEVKLDSGDAAGALQYLDKLGAVDSSSPALLILTARAAMQTGASDKAVTALEKLSSLRPLSDQEATWLAGQYRLVGNDAKALAMYEELDSKGALTSADGFEALGDLRMDAANPSGAVQAYQRIPEQARTARTWLKIARAADKAGNKQLALTAYDRFIATGTNDPELMLETARFMINAGRYDEALALYDQAVSRVGDNGLQLELAMANLAAKRFPQAEQWARKALASGEGGWKAPLALVQALHLQGKSGEADRILSENRGEIMAHREGKEWLGYVSVARDRQLQAFTIFSELIEQGQGDIGKFWLWRGIAATRRGDFIRAKESFNQARRYGKKTPAMPSAN